MGVRGFRRAYVASYLQPFSDARILDTGCGTGEILEFLPASVTYVGFDMSPEYIRFASKRYGSRGRWHCASVLEMDVSEVGSFDIVMANGVFHHLDDQEALQLSAIAASALKPSGRFCSFDGCFAPGQSKIARYLLSKDRGQNVRGPEGYLSLVEGHFSVVTLTLRHDMLSIPYTYAIIVATNPRTA